ncbi:MAG: enoyl-CoA hydratase/isomerase family protein [Acidimicrobiia bacterium]
MKTREYDTILYEERNNVAWITLNRPDVHNAFNYQMQREMSDVWRFLRGQDDVNAVVLTGAGDKAFCTGIDRMESMADDKPADALPIGSVGNPFQFDDPGQMLGPKSNDFWKPVIAAVNGMACGGAFYMLGEVEFIIAAEHATFFDPHVTYGHAAVFEPILMATRMPLGEIMRLSLMGNYERMSAARAEQIGLVSQVVAADDLDDATTWAAEAVAAQPPLAVQTTMRAIWAAYEMHRKEALHMGPAIIAHGNDEETMRQGQQAFESGQRIDWRLR